MSDDGDAEAVTPDEASALRHRVVQHDKRLEVLEHGADPMTGANPGLAEFLSGATGDEGAIVYDEALARESPCVGLAIRGNPDAPDAVVVNGALGSLSEDQVETYCSSVRIREVTPRQRERFIAFADAAHICRAEVSDLPHGDRFTPYAACMSRELRERGQKL